MGASAGGGVPPAVAALVWDMLASGITHELGSAPFPYCLPVAPAENLAVHVAPPVAPKGPAEAPMPVESAAAHVWAAGEGGGTTVVVAAEKEPTGAARQLLQNMLKAVGLAEQPVGVVGVWGAPAGLLAAGVAEALVAHIQAQSPARVLVLGQGPLGALVGQPCAVTPWHEAPTVLPLPAQVGPVGVTYALEHMLKYPTHKRAAWQHLRRWQSQQKGSQS